VFAELFVPWVLLVFPEPSVPGESSVAQTWSDRHSPLGQGTSFSQDATTVSIEIVTSLHQSSTKITSMQSFNVRHVVPSRHCWSLSHKSGLQ